MTGRHYVTTGYGQIRLHLGGTGRTLVALAGPTRAAATLLDDLLVTLPGRRVIVVEPPGVGGSARAATTSLGDCAAAVAESLAFLGEESVDLVAFELSAALAPAVAHRLRTAVTVLIGVESALGWLEHGLTPPSPQARDDGTHLNAFWSFLRDRRLVRADDPTLPIAAGPPLPGVADLSATFVAAVTDPAAFVRYWRLAAAALPAASASLPEATRLATLAELPAVLAPPIATTPADPSSTALEPVPTGAELSSTGAAPPSTGAAPPSTTPAPPSTGAVPPPTGAAPLVPPPTTPAPGTEIWHQYLDTAYGVAHLRRAGSTGRPVLVLATGGGSAAQFAPVLRGLAETRTAVAVDYFGNGLSQPRDRVPDIAALAREAFAVADALGWDTFDVWGSHTGACVALEMTVTEPDRIGKGVYEAPVMVTPEFRDDLLANYFPDFAPDPFGLHLQLIWNWRRDMFSYWPWYRVEHAATRAIGIPAAAELQLYAVGILESGTTYDLAYRAGFGYDTRSRLPHLRRPAILTAGPHDMLANALDDAATLVPGDLLTIVPTPATVWWPDPDPAAASATMRIYRDFLG
ncbi:alpha/beta fold hydrolase [Nocardia sp. BMG111209]|uniref:alpha/beta fold hydrolase n=1 Tax=Nocardia sp. BMG111209 TaxID=1160137 RepID=UPI00037C38F0|nr:alpha/beta hydrolase [Nocardia sp. BMG111209]